MLTVCHADPNPTPSPQASDPGAHNTTPIVSRPQPRKRRLVDGKLYTNYLKRSYSHHSSRSLLDYRQPTRYRTVSASKNTGDRGLQRFIPFFNSPDHLLIILVVQELTVVRLYPSYPAKMPKERWLPTRQRQRVNTKLSQPPQERQTRRQVRHSILLLTSYSSR